jgi:uncharacterized protein (DUF2267 family)
MHRDDPLTQVRIRARLHGRRHAIRVVRAVLRPLRGVIPEAAHQGLIRQLPADLALGISDRGSSGETGSCRELIRTIAQELHVHEPDAAFYARVTFEQLNAFCRGVTPAGLAASVPTDLRPLLSARADNAADRHRHLIPRLGAAVTTLDLRAPAAPSPQPERRTSGTRAKVPGPVHLI